MQHSQEDLKLLSEAEISAKNAQDNFEKKHLVIQDYIKSLLPNLLETTTFDINVCEYRWHDYEEIDILFNDQKYYWSTQFFRIELEIYDNGNIEYIPRESSGGIQDGVSCIDALRCKNLIYNSVFHLSENIDSQKIINLIKDRNNALTLSNNTNNELNRIRDMLTKKENEYKFNKIKKFIYKEQPKDRIQNLMDFITDRDKTNAEFRFITITPNNDFSKFEFEDHEIEMDNYSRLSLRHNGNRISQKALKNLLLKEAFINNSFDIQLSELNTITFKKRCSTYGRCYIATLTLEDLFEQLNQQIKIDTF